MGVLNDYSNIAPAHLAHTSPKLSLAIFNGAPTPYTHPCTTPELKQGIIARLQPFSILFTVRERTLFPASLLRELPNLELLATGKQFETFDLTTTRELDITVVAAPGKGRIIGKELPGRVLSPKLDLRQGGSYPTMHHTWALILALAIIVAADGAAMKRAYPNVSSAWQTGLAKSLTGTALWVVVFGQHRPSIHPCEEKLSQARLPFRLRLSNSREPIVD